MQEGTTCHEIISLGGERVPVLAVAHQCRALVQVTDEAERVRVFQEVMNVAYSREYPAFKCAECGCKFVVTQRRQCNESQRIEEEARIARRTNRMASVVDQARRERVTDAELVQRLVKEF
ncbi:MAG: hypothetical protein KGJ86_10235 [Chloroflexota bacterium]|nr:hypothetical protein [Chloroflexota bacterium]